MLSAPVPQNIATLSGRFHAISESSGRILEIHGDGKVRLVCFHPLRGRWWSHGRLDSEAGRLRFEGGAEATVEAEGPDRLLVGGRIHRRILDDGTIVDYARTIDRRYRSEALRLHLRNDGSLLAELDGPHGGMAERGHYDLHRGFAHLASWGAPRTIELREDGLRVGRDVLFDA